MKLPSQYQRGDRVAVVSCEELEEMLQIYGNDELSPNEIASIGSHIGTLLWLPSDSEMNGWDGRVPVKFDRNRTYNLPFAAIVEIPEGFSFVEEPDDEEEVKVIRDKASEGNLIKQMAAETIQSSYRRYRACRPAIKLRRVSSEEKLVMDMAANTIKEGLRSGRKKSSVTTTTKGRPPLPGRDIQTSNPSTPRTHRSQTSSSPRPADLDLFSTDSYCLLVSSIHVRGLQALKWTGKNDPYVRLSIGDWAYETPVVWSAPENIDWNDLSIIGLTSGGSDDLIVELFNANVVRENELIGSATHHVGDMCVGNREEIFLDIHEQEKRQRKRCRIEIKATLKVMDPSKVTSGPNEHNQKKTNSRKEHYIHVDVIKSPPKPTSKSQQTPIPPSKNIPVASRDRQTGPDSQAQARGSDEKRESEGVSKVWRDGDRVEVRYRGKAKYYPATIDRVRLHGTYDIDYDDGEKEQAVEPEFIRDLAATADKKVKIAFKVGDQVEARQLGRTKYFPGVVGRVNRDGSYDIKYDGGEDERGVQADMVRAVAVSARKRGSSKERPVFDQEESSSPEFKVGDRVEARYQNKDVYVPGVIARSRLGGKAFDIDYDNGDSEMGVKTNMIRTLPVAENDLKVNDRVEARYKGRRKFYPGIITRVRPDGTYDISYDDGEKEMGVERGLVKSVEGINTSDNGSWFKIGDRVEARYKGLVKYYPGVISRVLVNRTYNIDYDDGEKELAVSHDLVRSAALPHNKSDKMDVPLENYLTSSASGKNTKASNKEKELNASTDKAKVPKKTPKQRDTEATAKNIDSASAEVKMKRSNPKKKIKKVSAAVTDTIEEFNGFDFRDIDISPDTTRRIVDQAFEIALLEETSSIALKTHEVSLVLDALGIPLQAHAYDTLREDLTEEYGYTTDEIAELSGKDTVLLSLRSPALLAAVMTEYSNHKNLVATNKLSLPKGSFSLSENQAITAMKHLISLVHGVWKKARSTILSLVERGNSMGDMRPSLWPQDAVADFATILQFPRGKFDSYSGEDFININNSKIAYLIKPSILQCRCRLYSQVLRHLDDWWDRGMRPKDPISKTFSPTKHLETNVGVLSPHRKMNYLDSADAPFKKGSHVKISFHERLLRAYMPIHRAYAWSISHEDMTAVCTLIGGGQGTIAPPPFEHTSRKLNGMQWVNLTDKDVTYKNTDSKLLSALRDFDGKNDIVCGRCVYVPSSCLQSCQPQVKPKVPEQKTLADIPIEEVVKDMPVTVESLDMICKAYERFPWWDRPSSTVLMSIAGRAGKVVSAEHVKETGRVGVSVPCPNSVEVVDALPVEALIFIQPTPPKEKKTKSKIMYANKSGSKVVNGNIKDSDNESAPKSTASRKVAPSTYKAWLHPPLRDKWIDERDIDEGDSREKATEYLHGGDESIPLDADMEADAKWRRDEDCTHDISTDKRVSKDRTFLRPDRPLYRPITAHDLSTPPSSPREKGISNKTQATAVVPTYAWMRREYKHAPDQVIKSPRVTVSTATLDMEADRRHQGSYDARSDYDKNVSHISVNIQKQKTQSNQSREGGSRPKLAEEHKEQDSSRNHMREKVDTSNGICEPDLWVTGKSFSKDKNKSQDKNYPTTATTRPSSAGHNGIGRTGTASTRPKSATATRKPNQYAESKRESGAYPWMEPRNTAEENDTKYNEVLWRELRRTEQETKKREAMLRRQLKKMGSDDYDSYHNV